MKLNLEKVWQVMNTLSNKQSELSEDNVYINFMGYCSQYSEISFESFLDYYSFKINKDEIIVFNDNPVEWEDFNTDDFSFLPSVLLSFSAEKLSKWIETEIGLQLAKQGRDKVAEKEKLKRSIEMMTEQLNNL